MEPTTEVTDVTDTATITDTPATNDVVTALTGVINNHLDWCETGIKSEELAQELFEFITKGLTFNRPQPPKDEVDTIRRVLYPSENPDDVAAAERSIGEILHLSEIIRSRR